MMFLLEASAYSTLCLFCFKQLRLRCYEKMLLFILETKGIRGKMGPNQSCSLLFNVCAAWINLTLHKSQSDPFFKQMECWLIIHSSIDLVWPLSCWAGQLSYGGEEEKEGVGQILYVNSSVPRVLLMLKTPLFIMITGIGHFFSLDVDSLAYCLLNY